MFTWYNMLENTYIKIIEKEHLLISLGEIVKFCIRCYCKSCGLWEALLSVLERMKVKKVDELIFAKDLK